MAKASTKAAAKEPKTKAPDLLTRLKELQTSEREAAFKAQQKAIAAITGMLSNPDFMTALQPFSDVYLHRSRARVFEKLLDRFRWKLDWDGMRMEIQRKQLEYLDRARALTDGESFRCLTYVAGYTSVLTTEWPELMQLEWVSPHTAKPAKKSASKLNIVDEDPEDDDDDEEDEEDEEEYEDEEEDED